MNTTDKNYNLINQKLVERLKQSYEVIDKLEAKYNSDIKGKSEPIAIVGMGCRFPGGANSPDKFWDMLKKGEDAITEVPSSRWNIDEYDGKTKKAHIKSRFGGFIDAVDEFDASFFGISPREANSLDPQQRLILEVVWEAFEEGNQLVERLYGSNTGVFVAMSGFDYMLSMIKDMDEEQLDAYFGSGNSHATASGRIAYILGLQGPCYSVDTACSSSLVALHNACQSLRNKECKTAIVASSNLNLNPEINISFSEANMLSEDGHCKTFDNEADGYVRSEGIAAVLLKPLTDAEKDGDKIHALIRGSALNHDGASGGLTVPNGVAQQEVIKKALNNAQLNASDISYVEAHGTGTSLGDPIEVSALGQVYCSERDKDNKLLIGSVKTNIGHTEASAGMAGLFKLVMSLKNRYIPRHLNFSTPNTFIPWQDYPLAVAIEGGEWKSQDERIAGLSSFGFGGSNGHIIVSEAPTDDSPMTDVISKTDASHISHLVKLSAKSPVALPFLAQSYADHIEKNQDIELSDFAYTANTARTDHLYHTNIVANNMVSFKEELLLIAKQSASEFTSCLEEPPVAFLFSGQGSQYWGMGKILYETSALFKEYVDECELLLEKHMDIPLREILWGENREYINNTRYTQPALFSLQYALAKLWSSWGIEPTVLIGHSVGEYAAACIAGVFSLSDGLKLIAARGRLMSELCQPGSMAVIFSNESTVRQFLTGKEETIAIAAQNGPENTVISGDDDTLILVLEEMKSAGLSVHPLTVSHAFHSPLMIPMLSAFADIANTIEYQLPKIDMISNLTGVTESKAMTHSGYWVDHVRQAVQFDKGMTTLLEKNITIFIEIGPANTLLGMGKIMSNNFYSKNSQKNNQCWLASLSRNQEDWRFILISLGHAYNVGIDVDWQSFHTKSPGELVHLPTYPFIHKRYWHSKRDIKTDSKFNYSDIMPLEQQWLDTLKVGKIDSIKDEIENFTQKDQASLKKVVGALNRRIVKREMPLNNYAYQVSWQKMNTLVEPLYDKSRPVLIIADDIPSILALRQAYKSMAIDTIIVLVDQGTVDKSNTSEGIFTVDIACEKSWRQFFYQLTPVNRDFQTCLFYRHTGNEDISTFCMSLITSTNALIQYAVNCQLSVLTHDAVILTHKGDYIVDNISDNTADFDTAHTCAFGITRALAAEHPDNYLVTIDINDTEIDLPLAKKIISFIGANNGDELVALRSDSFYEPVLLPIQEQTESSPVSIASEGAYLVTGAYGGIGQSIVEWLLQSGATHIILVSRRKPCNDDLNNIINKWRAYDVKLDLIAVDVADKEQLILEYEKAVEPSVKLKGVFHVAGVSGDIVDSSELGVDDFSSVLAAKVQGTYNLQTLIEVEADDNFDLFVNFSSISSVWGAARQASYCAANYFLDRFSEMRKARGQAITCINWGPWADSGMGLKLDKDQFDRMGIEFLNHSQAMSLLQQVLERGGSQSLVCASVDWKRFVPVMYSRRHSTLLKELFNAADDLHEEQAEKNNRYIDNLHNELDLASDDKRNQILLNIIFTQVRNVCRLDESFIIDEKIWFSEQGIDSIMSVELNESLGIQLGIKLSPTILFDYPTPVALLEHLKTLLIKNKDDIESSNSHKYTPDNNIPETDKIDRSLEQITQDIDQMSEEEAELRLMEKLESI